LRGAVFNGAVPEDDRSFVDRSHNEFRDNDFSGMELIDVGFRTGIDLTKQKLPFGPEYLHLPDAPAAVQRARENVIGWDNLPLRQQAIALLRSLESEVAGGQQQLLLRIDDFNRPYSNEVIKRMVELLRTYA